jgi:hypothetical protein
MMLSCCLLECAEPEVPEHRVAVGAADRGKLKIAQTRQWA